MNYEFKWQPEALFALATFAVYFGTAFVATGNEQVTDWRAWALGTAVAGARVVVAALIAPITAFLTARKA